MCHSKTYKRLSDGALERVMRDVLNGMQRSFTGLAKPPARPETPSCEPPANLKTQPLPRFTSLSSEDLFGSCTEVDKPS
jgi:hypothetical protein